MWVSRRALSHRRPLEPPLPDALLQTPTSSVAVVVKLRSLDRGELDERVAPIIERHEHTLLVLLHVGEHVIEWAGEQSGRVTAIAYRRDPRTVNPPALPAFVQLQHTSADSCGSTREKLPEGVEFVLRQREALLEEARRDNAASRHRRSWPINDRSRA